jgi:hypothetical protein
MHLWVPLKASTVLVIFAFALAAGAQPPRGPPQRSAREAAAVDLTGHWVAQVTEDWAWRMLTPPKGDYASVPLNGAGRQAADAWDPAQAVAAGEECRAFGAGGIMRMPTRLKIGWADDETLVVETDAGQQTRLFHFDGARRSDAEPSWQGHSAAEWLAVPRPAGLFGFGAPVPLDAPAAPRAVPGDPAAEPPARAAPTGSLKVVTTNLRPGYLRKNGVPYSEDAVVTEYYDRVTMFGSDYLQVVTIVVDPQYLIVPYTVSNHFKREPDESKWNPSACVIDPPFGDFKPSPFVP